MRHGGLAFAVVAVGLALLSSSFVGTAAGRISFTTPLVLGYPAGDDWEPAVASDGQGNVYVAIPHYGGVPGCSACGNPSALIQVSHDGGRTFGAPKQLHADSAYQVDVNVKINAAGVVFVSYLHDKDTVVQKSTDFGATWSEPVRVNGGIKQGATDKPGLAVLGDDVYVGFNVAQRFFVSSSHDGGATWSAAQINTNTAFGWTLNGAAAVAPDGTVYMSWVGVHESGNALGPQDVFISKSTDKGSTWTVSYVDRDLPPGPGCPESCGWDFLGPALMVAVDAAGQVYVLYNAGTSDRGPPTVWYRTSTDDGATWSPRVPIHADGTASWHVFPALDAGPAGEIRAAWMDNHTGAYNVWYRSSSDGGRSWSAEVQVSAFRTGTSYVTENGFAWPYGDYFILDLDPRGTTHIAWGEGPGYSGPGNVLYAHN